MVAYHVDVHDVGARLQNVLDLLAQTTEFG
jgi:hypothetical protein